MLPMEHFSSSRFIDLIQKQLSSDTGLPKGTEQLLDLAFRLSLYREEDNTLRFVVGLSDNDRLFPSEKRFGTTVRGLDLNNAKTGCGDRA